MSPAPSAETQLRAEICGMHACTDELLTPCSCGIWAWGGEVVLKLNNTCVLLFSRNEKETFYSLTFPLPPVLLPYN